jgi:hypothetical protein
MKTRVVHCRRESYDIYIGRPSKWGNPFKLTKTDDRATIIEKYREWIMQQQHLLADIHELRGKKLGCWCSPQLCHGDVLAQLADQMVRLTRRSNTGRKRKAS